MHLVFETGQINDSSRLFIFFLLLLKLIHLFKKYLKTKEQHEALWHTLDFILVGAVELQ